MFVNLPIYLAIGAALGFSWSRTPRRPFRLDGFAVVYALIFAGAIFSLLPTWAKFDLGVLLLGIAAGRWFAKSANDRDKGIFLGCAALLVVLAALQYDLGILNGLTKFGAGSVSVEFTPQAARHGTTPGFVAEPTEKGPDAFPGAGRLNLAIGLFYQLGDFIRRDEGYALVFAGPSPGRPRAAFPAAPNPRLADYASYADRVFKPVAQRLYCLHQYERGEEPTLTITTTLAVNLRRAYQMALDGDDLNAFDGQKSGSAIGLVDAAMRELDGQIAWEHQSLGFLSKLGVDKSDYYKDCDQEAWAGGGLKRDDRTDAEASNDLPPLFAAVDLNEADDYYGYFGYFAIAAAAAEFAFGNRENAIQLLDREIRRESLSPKFRSAVPAPFQPCEPMPPGSDARKCEKSNDARLDWFRRLFLIVRLEYVQNIMIDKSEDENEALIPVNILTLERSIADQKLAFDRISENSITEPRMFEGAVDRQPNAACASTLAGDPGQMSQLAQNVYSIVTDENNELWISAIHPEIIAAEPSRIAALDAYADDVAKFDVQCLPKLNRRLNNAWEVRLRLLGTVAAYWEAKGQRFGVSVDDEDRMRRMGSSARVEIDALCKAERVNRLERQALEMARAELSARTPPPGPEPFAESVLDQRVEDYNFNANEYRVKSRQSRISSALKDYAQGDVEKYCAP